MSRAVLSGVERSHPAKFSAPILDQLADILNRWLPAGAEILDPFAGVGWVHKLRASLPNVSTVGVELEPEWAVAHPATIVGDARALPAGWVDRFDAVVTSCCYGNRLADSFDARDDSRRNTYRHKLGRPLSDGSAGALQWGPDYRAFHEECWREALRVVRPGGLFVLNVSDHYRAGARMRVSAFHLNTLLMLGCNVHEVRHVSTRRNGFGANGSVRVDGEKIIVAEVPE